MLRSLTLCLVAVVALATGCAERRRIRLATESPSLLVTELRKRELPYALQALFNIKVTGPDLQGTTSAAMIMARPDRFNVSVQTPLRTPLLYVASDGKVLHAYAHQNTTFYAGSDALAVLGELSGGAAGVPDLLLMMTGGLPLPDAEVASVAVEDELIRLELTGPHSSAVQAWIDPKTELFRRLIVRSQDESGDEVVWIRAEITNPMHFQGGWLPEELSMEFPTIGWSIEITFHTWDELGVIPDVFVLEAPKGAQTRDLVDSLKALAQEQGVRPQP